MPRPKWNPRTPTPLPEGSMRAAWRMVGANPNSGGCRSKAAVLLLLAAVLLGLIFSHTREQNTGTS